MTRDRHDPLAAARRLSSTADAIDLYARWAERYDHDVFDRMRVIGSRRIADLLAEHLPDRTTPVVDLGCGTGAVGVRLAEHGFTRLTGLDLSHEMLTVAGRTGAYEELVIADLNGPPTISGGFGGCVSAGTFTTGHVLAGAVPHLLALLRPGATLAWVVAPPVWPAFEDGLEAAGVAIRSCEQEPIRAGGADVGRFVIGIAPSAASRGPRA